MEDVEHISDQTLEQLALQTLPARKVKAVEGHMRLCPACRDRFASTGEYVSAMRRAARNTRKAVARPKGRAPLA